MMKSIGNKCVTICVSSVLILSHCGEHPTSSRESIEADQDNHVAMSMTTKPPSPTTRSVYGLTGLIFKWQNFVLAGARSILDTSQQGEPTWSVIDGTQDASVRDLFEGSGTVFQNGKYLVKSRSDDGSVAVFKEESPFVFVNALQRSQKIGRSLDVRIDPAGKVLLQLVLDPKAPSFVRILDYPLDNKVQSLCPDTSNTVDLIKDLGAKHGPCLIYFPKLVADAKILGDVVLGVDRAQASLTAIDISNIRDLASIKSIPCVGSPTRPGDCRGVPEIEAFFSSSEDGAIGLMKNYNPFGILKVDAKKEIKFEPLYKQASNEDRAGSTSGTSYIQN